MVKSLHVDSKLLKQKTGALKPKHSKKLQQDEKSAKL